MLPQTGPRAHPFYSLEDTFLNVSFTDDVGIVRRIGVRHKVTGEGAPIVLVHGLMTSSYSWRYVFEALGRRYRVFAPDLVGAGLSDKPLDLQYTVENVARFLAAYLRTISKSPVYLVGNSLGGLYGLRTVLSDGELVRRFVLMHAPGYPLVRAKLLSSIWSLPALGSAAAEVLARTAHRFPEQFVANNIHYACPDILSQEECAEYGRLFDTLDGARVFTKILEESLNPTEHAAIIAELQARVRGGRPLPCPVKILFARKDAMVPPSFGERFHQDIPGSELVWVDDASHFIQVDAPDRTVQEINAFDPLETVSVSA